MSYVKVSAKGSHTNNVMVTCNWPVNIAILYKIQHVLRLGIDWYLVGELC